HVQNISWTNDTALNLDKITLLLDAAPNPASISDATMIVALEAPVSFFNLSFGLPQNTTAPELPDISLILKGKTTSNGPTIGWSPNPASKTMITECIRFGAKGRIRVTLF